MPCTLHQHQPPSTPHPTPSAPGITQQHAHNMRTAQHSMAQRRTAPHRTAQHSTAEHSTTQQHSSSSTAQHSTAQPLSLTRTPARCSLTCRVRAYTRQRRNERCTAERPRAASEQQMSSRRAAQYSGSQPAAFKIIWAVLWAVCAAAVASPYAVRPEQQSKAACSGRNRRNAVRPCAAAVKAAAQQQPNVTAARAGPRRAAALQSPAIISHACVRVHIA